MRVGDDGPRAGASAGPQRALSAAVPEPYQLDKLPALDREIARLHDLHAPGCERASPSDTPAKRARHRQRFRQGAGRAAHPSGGHGEQHRAHRCARTHELPRDEIDQRTRSRDDHRDLRHKPRTLEQRLRAAHAHHSGRGGPRAPAPRVPARRSRRSRSAHGRSPRRRRAESRAPAAPSRPRDAPPYSLPAPRYAASIPHRTRGTRGRAPRRPRSPRRTLAPSLAARRGRSRRCGRLTAGAVCSSSTSTSVPCPRAAICGGHAGRTRADDCQTDGLAHRTARHTRADGAVT